MKASQNFIQGQARSSSIEQQKSRRTAPVYQILGRLGQLVIMFNNNHKKATYA